MDLRKSLTKWVVIYALGFCGFTGFAWFYLSDQRGGQFGDSFGLFNAAFSGLGLVGLAFAIFLQHRQLQMQTEELRLQREELALTREQLTRSAQAQEESEKALRKQLRVMALSSRLEAITILIREEERHLREHHQMTQVESITVAALEESLRNAQARPDASHLPNHVCLIQNLTKLISLKQELRSIHDELRKI